MMDQDMEEYCDELDRTDRADSRSDAQLAASEKNLFFSAVTVMFYGGLTFVAVGIDGVSWYAGTALALAAHGLLLAYRENCF